MSLTRAVAVEYVKTKLGVSDVDVTTDKLDLLNRIIPAIQSEVPFQNVSLNMLPVERRVPTLEDIIETGLSCNGGVCIHNNYFMRCLLEALGYDVFTIAGTYCYADDGIPNDHVMTIVRDLDSPGALHLVDVGCGFPTLTAVPLLELPFSFTNAGLEIMFIEEGDKYVRLQRKGEPLPDPTCPLWEDWRKTFKFDLVPRDLSFFSDTMSRLFGEEPTCHFTSHLRLYRCPAPGDHAVAIFDRELLTFRGTGPERRHLTEDEMESTIFKHFPNLLRDHVRKSLSKFRQRPDWGIL